MVSSVSDSDGSTCASPRKRPKGRGGVVKAFPFKLHDVLDSVGPDGYSHVVSWQPHGRCFIVHDHKVFKDIIIPKYFKQTKFASFQRQLNLYNFNRFTQGKDKGGYYHKLFVRGQRHLCTQMMRMKVKGTKVRQANQPQLQPDFYSMPAAMPTIVSRRKSHNSAAQQLASRNESKIRDAAQNLLSYSPLVQQEKLKTIIPLSPVLSLANPIAPLSMNDPVKNAGDDENCSYSESNTSNQAVNSPLKPLPVLQMVSPSRSPSIRMLPHPHGATITPLSASSSILSTKSPILNEPAVLAVVPPPPLVHASVSVDQDKQAQATIAPVPNVPQRKNWLAPTKPKMLLKPRSVAAPQVSPAAKDVLLPEEEDLSPQTINFLSDLFELGTNPHEFPSYATEYHTLPWDDSISPPACAFDTEDHCRMFFEGRPFYYIDGVEALTQALSV